MSIAKLSGRVLPTMNEDGSRNWLKPRVVTGKFWHARRWVAYTLIAFFVFLPFLRINDKQAVLLDLAQRKFTIFGFIFLPTDTLLLVLVGLFLFISIITLTSILGRGWCGWACPQTVYLEFMYRPLERLFEGTSGRGGKPANDIPAWRFAGYFFAALLVSLIPGHTLLAYFVGTDTLAQWMHQSPFEHPSSFLIMLIATGLMMFNFYFFREQTCLVVCPYGRFQSALIDRHSLLVSYDEKRGEPRGACTGPKQSGQALVPKGDCVDCNLCVSVCPTGIDIRKGLQMECVQCTQCIDACDSVMDKLHRPTGLIRYSSLAKNSGEPSRILRPRVIVYPILLLVLLTIWLTVFLNKPTSDVTLLRNFGNPFSITTSGTVSNAFRIKITNRIEQATEYRVELPGLPNAQMVLSENPLKLEPGASRIENMMIELPTSAFTNGVLDIWVRISDGKTFSRDVACRLLGPSMKKVSNDEGVKP